MGRLAKKLLIISGLLAGVGCAKGLKEGLKGASPMSKDLYSYSFQGSSTGLTDTCQCLVVVNQHHVGGNLVVTEDTTVNLASLPPGAFLFYSDEACTNQVSSVVIPSHNLGIEFCYKPTTMGSFTITASSTDGVGGTKTLTIGPSDLKVSASLYYHTCATIEGSAYCWGDNQLGQLGATSTDTCGAASCQKTPLAHNSLTSGVEKLATGGHHSCALTTAGAVKCWGSNSNGQLGDGSLTNSTTPVDTGIASNATDISAGTFHSCAVVSGGVQCWGRQDNSELGHASSMACGGGVCWKAPATTIAAGSGVISVASGGSHSCALFNNGSVKCWGLNSAGQCGKANGFIVCPSGQACFDTPVDVTNLGTGSGVTAIELGLLHSCALVNGAVQCWGDNRYGALGATTGAACGFDCSVNPVSVGGIPSGATALAAGGAHNCAIVSGDLKCWGSNFYGQLGATAADTCTGLNCSLSALSVLTHVSDLTAGLGHTCAVQNFIYKCWGDNTYGQLGIGNTTSSSSPVTVSNIP